jgi:hypothetical protein
VPWDLEIHTIDVGQGDSCLIVARDTVGNNHRNLLIDAGEYDRGVFVHQYVKTVPTVTRIQRVLVTNYDTDHWGGMTSLIQADNWWQVVNAIARAVEYVIPGGLPREYRLAMFAAAAAAPLWGGQGLDQAQIKALATTAQGRIKGGEPDTAAIKAGLQVVTDQKFAGLRFAYTAKFVANTVQQIVPTVTLAFDAGLSVRDAVFSRAPLSGLGKWAIATFSTGGLYASADVVDLGDVPQGYSAPAGWDEHVSGRLNRSSFWIPVGGTTRNRITPALGDEVLWPGTPPLDAPQVLVVAKRQVYWRNTPFAGSGQQFNDASLGVLVRHGSFWWWSGGDLPKSCENGLWLSLQANLLRDPRNPNGTLAAPPPAFVGFKCGHHGAQTATDTLFAQTVHAQSATVSCGHDTGFLHPRQVTIDNLHTNGVGGHFYLTNCNFPRTHVPASAPGFNQDQRDPLLAGNRSRVSGDNSLNNPDRYRRRGHIVTRVPAASAALAAGPRPYTVEYYESFGPGPGPKFDALTY